MDTPRFERDALVDAAIAAAGSDDLGEDSWQEGLGYLLDDLDGPARLNELGRTVAESDVVGYLTGRLAGSWSGGGPTPRWPTAASPVPSSSSGSPGPARPSSTTCWPRIRPTGPR